MTQDLLENLNDKQRLAVETDDGPILVLAGAGSGKTRVLTCKIARLMEQRKAKPWEILAVTFTNKAAGEMRKRVEEFAGMMVDGMWIGTFHSICARILRMEIDALGYQSNFSIYDTDDQIRQIQYVMDKLNLNAKQLRPRSVQHIISDNKNRMVSVDRYEQEAANFGDRQIASVYREYEDAMRRNNALDFDDLLLKTLDLFTRHDAVLRKYQSRFKYVLVDEYQDTNKAQYYIVKQIASTHRNICVVGDEDQSIYRWRGADIENILGFEKDYPEATVIRLEQNYRSTQNILDAANAVVANNKKRLGKNLWSHKDSGPKIQIHQLVDENAEALQVVDILKDQYVRNGHAYNDMAILYRTNAQSRALEDRLRRGNVPYTLVGGTKFYDRKEVKDVLAYLRILVNQQDAVALRRIVNYPSRGIGATSQERLETHAAEQGISLYEALQRAAEITTINAGTRAKMQNFAEALDAIVADVDKVSAYELAHLVIDRFRLKEQYQMSSAIEDETRLENINELLNSIAVFTEQARDDDVSLQRYLEDVSLLTDLDRWDPGFSAVTLMTLHSAKGLEFPVVIIAGMEEGLFPLFRSLEREDDLEEERRLFYVGMTRAEDALYLLWAGQRRRFTGDGSGMSYRNTASRFLAEIPSDFKNDRRLDSFASGYRPRQRQRFKERDAFTAAATAIDNEAGYKIGDWVQHDTFGRGQILGIEGSGVGLKLSILFGKKLKKIIAEYANLERLDK